MKKITVNDPESRSADLIAENLHYLKALFPEAFTEGKLDFAVLGQLLGGAVDEGEEKYGLNWHGKRRARQLALTPSTGTLRPRPEESLDWESTQNLMIEGDNLEVLKLLQKSYAGKVKLIYIDPPYNTGKDFIYPDDYRDTMQNYLALTGQIDGDNRKLSSNIEASGRFHTNWLNMMYPRLKSARNLLSDEGIIAVSIDDNEFSNVRHLLDEIFGGENLIGEVCASLNPKDRQLAQFFATSHEYLILYAKHIDRCVLKASSTDDIKQSDFPHEDERGWYRRLPLRNTNKKFTPNNRPNLYFPLYVNETTGAVFCDPSAELTEVYPSFGDGTNAVWRWSREKARSDSGKLCGRLIKGYTGNRWDIEQKDYLTEGRTKKIKTVWLASEVGSTDSAVAEVKELIGLAFDSPKPTGLLKRLILMMPEDSIMVDFFAGSGTTGHAVMDQNAADSGNRRYILVQFPEPLDPTNKDQKAAADFCDTLGKPRIIAELTKERLRRAASKITNDHPSFAGDRGFRVFKLDSSNLRAWEPDRDDLERTLLDSVEHIKPDRSEQDILYELLLKLGLDLCVAIKTRTIAGKTVYAVEAGALITCLDESIVRQEVEPLALGIIGWHGELSSAGDTTVIFRDSAFADDIAKTNMAAILEQYGLGNVRSL